MKKLPIGTQYFPSLIEDDCLYIDKTQRIYQLLTSARIYFLSRPRRFGKSLLISTLEAIFKGGKELFKDLWIESSAWLWQAHPVIRIDFAGLSLDTPQALTKSLLTKLFSIYTDYKIEITEREDLKIVFTNLITQLSSINKVVLLVDEYDKPIIEHIENPEAAAANRAILKQFYACIKPLDEYLKFVFLTGVSKFSQVSIFSDLNSLQDISMSIQYADLLGITQAELESQCKPHIEALAVSQNLTLQETYAKIKHWYNGFNFSEAHIKVYNPFSTLLLLSHQQFRGYWFATATPTFLIKLIKKNTDDLVQLEEKLISEKSFTRFEVEHLNLLAILFQTGYLTIESYDNELEQYKLCYPNYEVKSALLEELLESFSCLEPQNPSSDYIYQLITQLRSGNLAECIEIIKVFFANIPYEIQLKQEKYYQSIFYALFTLLGFKIQAEVSTNKGRIDAVVEVTDAIYIFEFKLYDTAQAALDQINTKEYYQKYLTREKKIILVGVGFDQAERNIGEYLSVEIEKN